MIEVPENIKEKTAAAVNGYPQAMGAVFQFYRPRLLAHAMRICGNTPLAQDAVQDTFIAAFTHLSSLRNPDLFYPWLKKILVNNCYLLLRRERSVELTDKIAASDTLIQKSIDLHFETISNRQRLFDALQLLSDELCSCVLLRYFSELKSYEEIALTLGIPVGTVRSRLAAAREKLTAQFLQNDDAADSALIEAEQWSDFYIKKYEKLYDDLQTRNELLEHHHRSLNIRFTSGISGKGRNLLEGELNNDLFYGSRFEVHNVISSGNLSVIEGPNINNPDFPDRCAPHSAIVVFRKNDTIETMHLFDSPRS